ncbi:MAG: hypothetical protein M1472_04725 [Planctomycetes bacterium]|nr:hypothetical protein [Planctomycetota bacterium]
MIKILSIVAFGGLLTLTIAGPAAAAGVDNGLMPLPTPTFAPNNPASVVNSGGLPSWAAYHTHPEEIRLMTQFGYFNDYWFRYHDVAPNRLNLQNITRLSFSLHKLGSVYLRTFTDYSYDIRNVYINSLAQGTAGTPVAGGNIGFVPSSNFTEADVTIGYQYDLMDLLRVDTGYTNYITPVSRYFVPSNNPIGNTVTGHGQEDSQEAYIRLSLNDDRYFGQFAFHPFIMVGFDYNGAYYTSGAGQYFEVGVDPIFVVPHTGGLTIYSPLSVSFIHDEKRLDVNRRSYRDGYLGTFVGTTITYPLNGICHIPENRGHYEIGAVINSIFAGTRYAQPAGTHSDATIVGLFIRMTF